MKLDDPRFKKHVESVMQSLFYELEHTPKERRERTRERYVEYILEGPEPWTKTS